MSANARGRTAPRQVAGLLNEPGPAHVRLTKEIAAEREIATAVRLFFARGDPVSVHLLASAASAVLTPIGQSRGITTTLDRYRELFVAGKEHLADAIWSLAYNYMKHGERDESWVFQHFNPAMNEYILMFVIEDFQNIFKRTFKEAMCFLYYFGSEHPNLILSRYEKLRELARHFGADLDRVSFDVAAGVLRQIDFEDARRETKTTLEPAKAAASPRGRREKGGQGQRLP
jgi:hypothetical protein